MKQSIHIFVYLFLFQFSLSSKNVKLDQYSIKTESNISVSDLTIQQQASKKIVKNDTVKQESLKFIEIETYADIHMSHINRPQSIFDKPEHETTIYYPRQYYTSPAEYRTWHHADEVQRVKNTSGPW